MNNIDHLHIIYKWRITKPFIKGKQLYNRCCKRIGYGTMILNCLNGYKNSKENDSFVLTEEHKLFFHIYEINF